LHNSKTVSLTRSLLFIGLVLAGCSDERTPIVDFEFAEEGQAVPVAILKRDSTTTPRGYRVAELHVFLPVGITEADARATLQHLIDSVGVADTLAAAVRVVGFLLGEFNAASGQAELQPALSAFWSPTDSLGITGSRRTARFRTSFTVIKEFQTPGAIKQ